jgi:hypothetical protein
VSLYNTRQVYQIYDIIFAMENIKILCTILEESADYSKLINDLTGNYIAQDITVDERGEELETPIEHPHKNLTPPDFSGNITFAHYTDGYNSYEGVSHIKEDSLSTSKAWNRAFKQAQSDGATHLVILNGVSNINPHQIALALEEHSDKDVINLSDGGAFIVKCSSDFNANEEYNLWFADNQIFEWAVANNSYATGRYDQPEIIQADIVSLKNEIDAAIEADTKKANI